VDLPQGAVDLLAELQKQRNGTEGEWVFTDSDGGPLRKSNFGRRYFKPLVNSLGLKVRFHELRHTANSLLIAQGFSANVAAERLGHADTRTTMDIYSHVLPSIQREAAVQWMPSSPIP
jgi:integrase